MNANPHHKLIYVRFYPYGRLTKVHGLGFPSTTNCTDNQLVTNLRTTFTHNWRKVVRFLWLKNSRKHRVH